MEDADQVYQCCQEGNSVIHDQWHDDMPDISAILNKSLNVTCSTLNASAQSGGFYASEASGAKYSNGHCFALLCVMCATQGKKEEERMKIVRKTIKQLAMGCAPEKELFLRLAPYATGGVPEGFDLATLLL